MGRLWWSSSLLRWNLVSGRKERKTFLYWINTKTENILCLPVSILAAMPKKTRLSLQTPPSRLEKPSVLPQRQSPTKDWLLVR